MGGPPLIRVDENEGWIEKVWTMGGPPFRRVVHTRVDHRKVDDGWTTLPNGGSYRVDFTRVGEGFCIQGSTKGGSLNFSIFCNAI